MRIKKKHTSTIILLLAFIIGLSLVLYPTVSNYVNNLNQTKAISNYVEDVFAIPDDKCEEMLEQAQTFNNGISKRKNVFLQSKEEQQVYDKLLNINGSGIMGYLEIPQINVTLPIYHGASNSVLQIAVGHLDWSSLPVGGEGTHCVLSGHRGLPSAKIFTNLDKLTTDDEFIIKILNKELTYRVDQILIVEPEDTTALQIEDGEDYCSLVTCTPYGINTHRLIVRGKRVVQEETDTVHVTAEAVQIEPLIVSPVLAVPLLGMLILIFVIKDRKPKHKNNAEEYDNA